MNMTLLRRVLGVVCVAGFAATVLAEDDSVAMAKELLGKAGAVSVAGKEDAKPGLKGLYLGYDAAGKVIAGLAIRETATYKKSDAVLVVTPTADGKYTLSTAAITDLETFHGKSKDLAAGALADVTGKVIVDAAGARGLVDAVSGATKYLEAIYISYSVMASAVIEAMANPPAGWEPTPLATAAAPTDEPAPAP